MIVGLKLLGSDEVFLEVTETNINNAGLINAGGGYMRGITSARVIELVAFGQLRQTIATWARKRSAIIGATISCVSGLGSEVFCIVLFFIMVGAVLGFGCGKAGGIEVNG
jgi:hypothetical protein